MAFAVFLTACTNMYSHSFRVAPAEQLTPDELRAVFVGFKGFLTAKRMREVTPANNVKPDYAAFQLGGGKSGLLREPFEEYLELSYQPEEGFVLKITRIISHPIDFSENYIAEFRSKTEQFIREATSKHVRLRVIPTPRPPSR